MKRNPFVQYQKQAEASVRAVTKRIVETKKKREYLDLSVYPIELVRVEIFDAAAEVFPTGTVNPNDITIAEPPAHVEADISVSVFEIGKKAGLDPVECANRISAALNGTKCRWVRSAMSAGPFLNIMLNEEYFYGKVILSVVKYAERYGQSGSNKGRRALIEYSSPNVAKPIGIGHLRSTIIGQALVNLYFCTGYDVIKDNHLGDWGTQFGALIYAYKNWGDPKAVQLRPLQELKNLYVRFHDEAAHNPELEASAREVFRRLEAGDPEFIALWEHFVEVSLAEFNKVYKRLGVSFDTMIGESYFNDRAHEVTDACLKKGVAKKDPVSLAVAVDSFPGVPSFLLVKQDGSTLYHARDLATIAYRVEALQPDVIAYVVGQEQALYFRQLFLLARAAGFAGPTVELKHIDFGLMLSDGKKMSTRRGTVVELESVIDTAVDRSKQMIKEKNKDMGESETNETAEILALGAVVYNDLRQSRIKNISFDWDRMLDFEGGSAAYLQYTCVRIQSLLKKASVQTTASESVEKYEALCGDRIEFLLARKLAIFPYVLVRAQEADAPHTVCVYLEEAAQLFNEFYNKISIMGTDNADLRRSRLALAQSVRTVLGNGLALLNIQIPDRM